MVRSGLSCWFDKVNIPHADDYQERINHGINSAHNFVFVISPTSIRSPFCLLEVVHARLRGKRIIPLLHVAPKPEDWKFLELQLNQKIKTLESESPLPSIALSKLKEEAKLTKDAIHILQKIDWIYGREEEGDLKEIERWKTSYENSWKRHEDPKYLEQWECPVRWKSIDAPEAVVEKLQVLFGKQQNYIQQHTQILLWALRWEQRDYEPNYLLTGVERIEAESWLNMNFQLSELPPCQKTDLQCEFITESRKNAEGNSADVFTSFISTDNQIQQEIVRELTQRGITCWNRDKNMKKGIGKQKGIEAGIEQSDNFLFFVSPSSVQDPEALAELQKAQELNKRILPLLVSPVDAANWPESIRRHGHVDFTDNESPVDFEKDIVDILAILNQDRQYYHDHKRLLTDALRWQYGAEKNSFLLRGYYLEKAVTWLDLHKDREISPPTVHHERLIKASEEMKGKLSTEVMICYSRKDDDFARSIHHQLQAAGKTTWFDQENIDAAPNFQHELFKGIAKADNVLFILSDDYLDSTSCQEEFNHAYGLNKRIFVIRYREMEARSIPAELSAIQALDFESQSFDKAFGELVNLLETDREHTNKHTVFLERAQEWDANEQSGDYLLNRSAFNNANQWLEQADVETSREFPDEELETLEDVANLSEEALGSLINACTKKPQPTLLQMRYILASQQAILREERHQKAIASRLRIRLRLSVAASILAFMVAIGAIYFFLEAQRQTQIAQENEKYANEQKEIAEGQKRRAEEQTRIAEEQKLRAEEQKRIAEINEEKARNNEKEAIRQQQIALNNEREAKRQEKLAQENAAEALKQRNVAETQRSKADSARNRAKREEQRALRLKNLAESRNESLTAIRRLNASSLESGARKAVKAFELNQVNEGPKQNKDNYLALLTAYKFSDSFIQLENEHKAGVRTMAVNPISGEVATGDDLGRILISTISKTSIAPIKKLKLRSPVRSLRYSSDGEYLVAGTEGGRVLYWDKNAEEPKEVASLDQSVPFVSIVGTGGQRQLLFQAGRQLYRSPMGRTEVSTISPIGKCNLAKVNKEGTHLIAAMDSLVTLFQIEISDSAAMTLRPLIKEVLGPGERVSSLALSDDMAYLSIGTEAGKLYLYRTSEQKMIPLTGHGAAVSDVVFHVDKEALQLVSVGYDQHINLIDVEDWLSVEPKEDLISIPLNRKWLYRVTYSLDGELIMVAGANKGINVWLARAEKLSDFLKSVLATKRPNSPNLNVNQLHPQNKKLLL